MRTVKIAVTLDQDLVAQLDQLVEENQFPSRSRAVQQAVRDKLQQLQRIRLARESAKLDPAFEQALADEGLTETAPQSFLRTARTLELRGPADWSANLDDYLNGDGN